MKKVLKKSIMKRLQLRSVLLKKRKKHQKTKLHLISKGAIVPIEDIVLSCFNERKTKLLLKY